jgi:selenocysteine-specific elongation factor
VRVREIQSFGAKRTEGLSGERLALALQGVRLEEIERGDMLATPSRFVVTDTVDVRVTLASDAGIELANRERVRIHHGAREVLGRVILFERDELHGGESSLAQLRLEQPIVADVEDRAVIRSYSPARVIGGAVILDPRAQARRRSDTAGVAQLRLREEGDPADVLAKSIEQAGVAGMPEGETESTLRDALVSRGDVIAIAGRVYHRDVLSQLAAGAIATAEAHTRRHPLQWGIDKEELRRRLEFPHSAAAFNRLVEWIAASHPLFVRGSRVRAGSQEMDLPAALESAVNRLRDDVAARGIAFASRDELEAGWSAPQPFADAVTVLKGRGEVVDVGDGLVHPAALEQAAGALRAWFAAHAELAVGDLKDMLGITRKHAIPLLELFDQRGLTARKGNSRVAGSALSDAKKSG